MNFNILDDDRKNILPFFIGNFSDFYLAGGTALALFFGHRKSIDFDFFTEKSFDSVVLFEECKKIFLNNSIIVTQQEKNTLSLSVDGVKISFFTFPYVLLKELEKTQYFSIASLKDISAMKCLALVQRATQKDYIDIYFLLQKYSLEKVLHWAKIKFPDLSSDVIVKSLIYFDDIEFEEIEYLDGENISWEIITQELEKKVSNYIL